jgi:hypothetical protein
MNDRNFDELLRKYADSPVPSLPGSFTQDVLREIRLRKESSRHAESWFSEIYTLFFRPGPLVATFSLVALVALSYPSIMSSASSATAVSSLGLDVFSHSTIHLPSELLSNAK